MALGRMYTIVDEEVAVTTAVDICEINSAADSVTVVHGVTISQSSDAGDTESEQLNVLIHLGSTSGSGGTTITPAPTNLGDAAFGGTAETFNTTQATEGTRRWSESWNIMAGMPLTLTPEGWSVISPSDRLIIELQTAPADSLTMSVSVLIEEIGG
jgi:hypothetical protein